MIVPERIQTNRLVLRRHRLEDLDAFIAFLGDAAATRYMAFTPEQKTPEGARQMLDYVIASYATDAAIFSLTIADPVTDRYLGSCGANPDGEDIEIYYTILPEFQGEGLATDAARALVEHLAAATPARIVAYVVEENAGSVRVAERLGFADAGPVDRRAASGELEYAALAGRKYVLDRRP
jgi:RimJ/RimL family protein N-acetyltransferase